MLGVSSVCSDAPATAAPSATEANESVGGGPSSGGILLSDEEKLRIEDGDRSSGGNRWPRQETLVLLKIRSDMDVVFRDSSLKGPLWEEVSRKLAELGYQRSAKKCKEKFENVYKYHRRTKEGRSTKPDGKTYRFFDQLEALENQPPPIPSLPPPPPRPQIQQPTAAIPVAAAAAAAPAMPRTNPPTVQPISTVPSAAPNPITVPQNTLAQTSINPTNPSPQSQSNLLPTPPLPPTSSSVPMTITAANPISISYNYATIPSCPHPNMSTMNFASISTSSSTSSDEEPERRCKRKRKWGDFFQRLMSEVIDKQEEMQRKFLDTLEKRERDRVAREEAWRVQEMARMNREHELLVQERSVAAAKDAAVIAFLQKISDQEIPNIAQMQMHFKDNPIPLPSVPVPPPPQPQPQPQPQPVAVLQAQVQAQAQPPPAQQQQQQPVQTLVKRLENPKLDNGGENFGPSSNSSSRWPKAEVQALIRLRTNMDNKYQENVPKGPLWEEISAAMRKIGYDRSAKRCKEKWENINKYFKKVKESNKKRPEDSKTCPYFHQLDALYKEKAKTDNNSNNISTFNHGFAVKSENPMVPIMVQPEQQWPLQQEQQHEHHHGQESEMEGNDSDNFDDDDVDGDDEDGDDEVSGYEIVTNKPASVGTVNE